MSMTIEEKREKTRLRNIEWRKNNREKCCKSTAQWHTKNPEYESGRKLKKRYNITPEQYIEMLIVQDHRCAICGNKETALHNHSGKVQKLAIDHCHITGKVRGLLCQDCNRGLGKFHDNLQHLQKAIDYLSKHQT